MAKKAKAEAKRIRRKQRKQDLDGADRRDFETEPSKAEESGGPNNEIS